jgi:hypothetical protein
VLGKGFDAGSSCKNAFEKVITISRRRGTSYETFVFVYYRLNIPCERSPDSEISGQPEKSFGATGRFAGVCYL